MSTCQRSTQIIFYCCILAHLFKAFFWPSLTIPASSCLLCIGTDLLGKMLFWCFQFGELRRKLQCQFLLLLSSLKYLYLTTSVVLSTTKSSEKQLNGKILVGLYKVILLRLFDKARLLRIENKLFSSLEFT